MAHFAKVINGIVSKVIVADANYFDSFIDETPGEWIQTSYNTLGGVHYAPESNEEDGGTPLRKNFAGVGFTYDVDRDAFIPPQTFPSHTLNEDTCLWECPVDYPMDGASYNWDESTLSWVVRIA